MKEILANYSIQSKFTKNKKYEVSVKLIKRRA